MSKPEDMQQEQFDNGGDESLREDRGDFFEADDEVLDEKSAPKAEDDETPEEKKTDAPKADTEGEEEGDEDETKGNKRAVPYDRFNAVNDAKKALEQQNELLRQMLEQAKAPQQPVNAPEPQAPADNPEDSKQLRDLRRQLKEALYSDDEARYDEIQDQIDAINERRNRAIIRAEMEARQAQEAAAQEQRRFVDTANRMVAQYPVLHAETGNPDAIKKVVALRDYYINTESLSPAAALEKASVEIGELYSGSSSKTDDKETGDRRRAAAIERGVKEANDQPPPTAQAGVGSRAQSARLNVERMSEREFNSLPEEERARLRGDVV